MELQQFLSQQENSGIALADKTAGFLHIHHHEKRCSQVLPALRADGQGFCTQGHREMAKYMAHVKTGHQAGGKCLRQLAGPRRPALSVHSGCRLHYPLLWGLVISKQKAFYCLMRLLQNEK